MLLAFIVVYYTMCSLYDLNLRQELDDSGDDNYDNDINREDDGDDNNDDSDGDDDDDDKEMEDKHWLPLT